MATDDLLQHVKGNHDFYALLELPNTASLEEIRRAYRRTALKYHPDKVGASDPTALDKFHLLQTAYDVLSDVSIREQYDAHRRAKEAAAARTEQLSARRQDMIRDLERREQEGLKRKRGEGMGMGEDVERERELEAIRADNKRRRVELEERRRREAEALEKEDESEGTTAPDVTTTPAPVAEMQRAVKVRFPLNEKTAGYSSESLSELFSRFGAVETVVLRAKAPDSTDPAGGNERKKKKKKQPHGTALLVYKSVVGAHAAVSDFPRLAVREPETWSEFEFVEWAEGKEPDFVPKVRPTVIPETKQEVEELQRASSPHPHFENGDAKEKPSSVPRFGSFKPSAVPRVDSGGGAPGLDEITIMRLKNAERRRLEEKIRREEAASEAET